MSCSSAGAFLNTAGQKIPNDLPPSLGLSNEILQIPENSQSTDGIISSPLPSSSMAPQPFIYTPPSTTQSSHLPIDQHINDYHNRRKRKSKRSVQREKLEKTFKEKGFLIQTQQLESAEGATYCKFRQLKKFTRYLFRSWKDYLPKNCELPQNQGQSGTAASSSSFEIHPSISSDD